MKIRLLVGRAGTDFAQNRGDEIDVDTEEGLRMIAAEQAELIRQDEPEKAVKRGKVERT